MANFNKKQIQEHPGQVLEVINFNHSRNGNTYGMFSQKEEPFPLPANLDYRKLIEDSNLFKTENPAIYYDIVKQIGSGGYGKIY
jgi:hypothetical protein